MSETNKVLLRIEALMVFVDCKVLMLFYFIANLWRETSLLGDLMGNKKVPAVNLATQIWHSAGSDLLIWIPVVIIADIIIKSALRKFIER